MDLGSIKQFVSDETEKPVMTRFDITRGKFLRWLETEAPAEVRNMNLALDKFQSVVSKLNRRLKNAKFNLYRAISIFEGDDPMEWVMKNKYSLGTSWTWDKASARPYRNINPNWEKIVILTAQVEPEDVDIYMTVALNLSVVRGDFEREIRLKKGAEIEIIGVDEMKVSTIQARTKVTEAIGTGAKKIERDIVNLLLANGFKEVNNRAAYGPGLHYMRFSSKSLPRKFKKELDRLIRAHIDLSAGDPTAREIFFQKSKDRMTGNPIYRLTIR